MAGSHCLGHSSPAIATSCHQPVFCNLNVRAAATPRYCSHSAFWTFPIFSQTRPGSCPGPGRVGLKWLKCPRSEVRVSPCLVAAKAIHGPCKSLCYFPKGSHVPHTQWTKTATLHTLFRKDDPVSAKSDEPITRVCIIL